MEKQYDNFVLRVLDGSIVISTKEPMWETHILATSEMYYYLKQMAEDETMDSYVHNWILNSFINCTNLFDEGYFVTMVEEFSKCIERIKVMAEEPTDEEQEQILEDERKRELLRQTAVLESENKTDPQE